MPTHTYIKIYAYKFHMCVCVCVCRYICLLASTDFKMSSIFNIWWIFLQWHKSLKYRITKEMSGARAAGVVFANICKQPFLFSAQHICPCACVCVWHTCAYLFFKFDFCCLVANWHPLTGTPATSFAALKCVARSGTPLMPEAWKSIYSHQQAVINSHSPFRHGGQAVGLWIEQMENYARRELLTWLGQHVRLHMCDCLWATSNSRFANLRTDAAKRRCK